MKLKSLFETKGLNRKERVAFKLHMWAEILEGFSVGAIALNEFVFLKSLDGASYLVGVLFQVSIAIMLFSIFLISLSEEQKIKSDYLKLLLWSKTSFVQTVHKGRCVKRVQQLLRINYHIRGM